MQPRYVLPRLLTGIPSVPIWTALLSFGFGTLLLLLYIVSSEENQEDLLYIGLVYLLAAFIINVVVMLIMIALSFIHKNRQREILINTSVQLLNIPVAVIYFFIIFS